MDMQFNSVTGLPSDPFNAIKKLDLNPLFLLILVGILVIFYIVFSVISNNNNVELIDDNAKGGIIFLEILLWSVFIILILINGIAYFFNINIITSLKDIFSPEPRLQIKAQNYLSTDSSIPDNNNNNDEINNNNDNNKLTEEVFNIPENIYTYNQAEALCKAYNGRLANYQEIEKAYNNGAEWCNYGWSDNQLALFPTNLKTWKKLQTIKGHENDCGRAGINGGYIANPNVRFGVNCFGKRPKITGAEQILMDNSTLYPLTVEELRMEKKVNNFKNKLNTILISPFNHDSWSMP